MLTTFAAIYFGVVRWLAVESTPPILDGSLHALEEFAVIGAICLLLAVFSIPFLLTMADSLVWLAVWVVRRPSVRRWLSGRRPCTHDE